MIVVLVASLAVLIGLVVALVLMRGDRLSVHAAPATSTMSGGLPPGELSSRDIDDVRFDTVVRGYDQDNDIRDLRSARPHRRKRFMSGRIQKHDIPVIDVNVIGADGLGDTAGLS